jgi:hypothetical protein
MYEFGRKMDWAKFWAIFSTNSSGHLDADLVRFLSDTRIDIVKIVKVAAHAVLFIPKRLEFEFRPQKANFLLIGHASSFCRSSILFQSLPALRRAQGECRRTLFYVKKIESSEISHIVSRVARWLVFKPKILIWVNLGGSCNWSCWYILWTLGPFYDLLLYFMDIWYSSG